ncbi:MAG: AAA family ATPase [Candidatus Eremiobacteraeota bacterium]|nr:AAA family ATPase [Candidatus Eremiobacteraeota bacterium]
MNRWRIRRERVVERLRRSKENRVALVLAEAGYGKSVAVAQFVASNDDERAFYRVPPETKTLLAFLRGLTEALESVVPGAHLSLTMAHERAMQSPKPFVELATWFAEHLRHASTRIVIDDLHNATSEAVGDFLDRAIVTSSSGVRWLIATRPVRTFSPASWLAGQEMEWPVDETELRFTSGEVAELARNAGVSLSPSAFADVMRLSEGWPSAVGLALSLGEADLATIGTASQPEVFEALARRVFARQEPSVQEVLLQSATFSELDRKVLRASGIDFGEYDAAYVEELGNGRARYDSLFRDFLLRVQDERGAEAQRDALIRAATAYERIGRFADALRYDLRAGAYAAVARLLAQSGFTLLEAGEVEVVEAGLERVEEDELHANPPLLALKAVLDSQRARFDTSEAWFRLAIHELTDRRLRLHIVYRYALDLMRRGRLDSIELLEPAVEEAASASDEIHPLLCATLATAYALSDRLDEARALIARAIPLLESSLPVAMRARALHQAAYVALRAGETAEAEAYARRVLELAVPEALYDIAARAHSILYEIALAWEANPRKALEHVENVASFALRCGDAHVREWALIAAYYIEAERGNGGMMSAIERSLNTADVLQMTDELTTALLPGQALRATWGGDFAHAHRLLAHSAGEQVTPDRRALRWAEIAVYAAGAGQEDEARIAIGAARAELTEAAPGKHTVQALAYLLIASSMLQDAMTWLTVRGDPRFTRLSPSLGSLLHAADALHEHWAEKRDHDAVLSALEELRTHDLGGVAAMLEALPATPQLHGKPLPL